MHRWDIINHYAKLIKAKSYLEIGLDNGTNFKKIEVAHKVSVDPNPKCKAMHVMQSDEFFSQNIELFDIIFVDGLHTEGQVAKDMVNACECIRDDGVIIFHDMNPSSEKMQGPKPGSGCPEWTGDGWKAWVLARASMKYVSMFVIDTDYGCGVMRTGQQRLIKVDRRELDWDFLCEHRTDVLNLITVDKWNKIKNSQDFQWKL